MKKILLMLSILLLSTICSAQWNLWDGQVKSTSTVLRYEYKEDALRLFGRMVVVPDSNKRRFMEEIIIMILDTLNCAKLSDRLVFLYFLDNYDYQISHLNWVSTSYDITNNGCSWDTSGVTGDGVHFLNTNFNPVSDSVVFKINNSSMGAHSATDVNENTSLMGHYVNSTSYSYIRPLYSGQYYNVSLNNPATDMHSGSWDVADRNSIGLYVLSITDSLRFTKNGLHKFAWGNSGTVLVNTKMGLLCQIYSNTNPILISTRKIDFAFAGSGLSISEIKGLYAIKNYWKANKNSK